MIKEQSCPSCTMASTTCDQSWGPSVPGTVHHAQSSFDVSPGPRNRRLQIPQRAPFVLPWNPWQTMPLEYLSLGFTRRSQKLRKRGDQTHRPLSVFASLSHLWHNSPSLTIRLYIQTPPSFSRYTSRHFDVCVTVARPDIGMYGGYKFQAATS